MRDAGLTSVEKYYAYKATKAVEFYRPVMYLYLLSQGLSFTQITILEALYNLTTVVGEVPTGYIGDRVGRRNSLLIGTALISMTLVAIGLASTFAMLAALWVCWSVGYNFRSGSEDAWLYDTITDELTADQFAHVWGRGQSIALLIGVGASIVGGYLAGIDLAYPFFVAAAITALGVPILLSLTEPATYEATPTDDLTIHQTLGIVRRALGQRNLRSFILYYYMLFAAVLYLASIFVQPVFETVVLDFGVAESKVEGLLGWYFAAISLLGAGLSYWSGTIKEHIGIRTWFHGLPFAVAGALIAAYFVPALALVVLLLTRSVADVTRALASQYVNDRVGTAGRATVLSAMAMVSGLAVIPFQLASGVLSDLTSPLLALGIGGVVLAIGSVAVIGWEQPVSQDDLPMARQ